MNKASLTAVLGALGALVLVTACAPAEPGTALPGGPAATVNVRGEMQRHLNPAMLGIWEVTNNAMNDEGAIDPALMDAAKWQQVAAGAHQLAESGTRMAAPAPLIAAAPGNTEVDEGEVSMADIQRHLDGDPQLFRQMATAFAAHSARLAEAAQRQDAAAIGTLVADMDGVCESCHARFWYPEQ